MMKLLLEIGLPRAYWPMAPRQPDHLDHHHHRALPRNHRQAVDPIRIHRHREWYHVAADRPSSLLLASLHQAVPDL